MPGSVDRGKLAEALDMVTILRQSYIDHGLWRDLIPILDAAQAVLEAEVMTHDDNGWLLRIPLALVPLAEE